MAEDKKSANWQLEKLAEIADKTQNLYEGRATIVFELKSAEYKNILSQFRDIDRNHKQFKIDISGTEFIFILIEEST